VSALVPYKRLDLAIEACRRGGVPLRVVGRGPELPRLQALAAGADIEFLGWRSDEEIRQLYQTAEVVLLPGTEDFGMVPVEAQACGTPVVALDAGGARETVIPGLTGSLVPTSDPADWAEAIEAVRRQRIDREAIRRHAERFSVQAFRASFSAAVAEPAAPKVAAS
jgi:glycosyltransferase involved in cell wall biosynthesis